MLRDNQAFNQSVKANAAFLAELREKLPEFFSADKYDDGGQLIEEGSFDLAKFHQALEENNSKELTSGYRLDFIGKDYAKKQAGEKPTTVILPDREHNSKPENKDSQNLFLTGDNLEVLRHLQASYDDQVDVIYIDPPYNTGSDGFVYPDKFEYSDDNLQAMFGLSEEELKRLKSIQGRASHSAWLTFMYPRLWLAKRLLKDSGVIFVSIDDNEQANLKLLMDELFGEGQFVANVIWSNKEGGGSSDSKHFRVKHEYVVVYSKNLTDLSINGVEVEDIDRYRLSDEYEKTRGKHQLIKLDSASIQYSKSLDYPIKAPDGTDIYAGKGKIKSCWRWSVDKFNWGVQNGYVVIKKDRNNEWAVYTKQYLNADNEGNIVKRTLQPLALIDKFSTTQSNKRIKSLFGGETIFKYSKPVDYISYLLRLVTNNNSLILDFFAGSGTTADAVMHLNAEDGGNRRYIMVQLHEPTFSTNSDGTEVARKGSETAYQAGFRSIDEISRKRIELASQKIQAEKDLTNFDGGFKHYRVLAPTQTTLDDLDRFDVADEAQLSLLEDLDFSDMVTPFSSKKLGYDEGAKGQDTILATWLLADGYGFDREVIIKDFAAYQAPYVSGNRLYLIEAGWTSDQTKALLNAIGKNELTLQTIVLYAYSFSLENLRELELALNQLDTKINLIKRY